MKNSNSGRKKKSGIRGKLKKYQDGGKQLGRKVRNQSKDRLKDSPRKPAEPRSYYGIQEPEYTEGGGFGRHRDTVSGQSQEGSRNPSGTTVQPRLTPIDTE
jgi:hypothetical protein